EVTGFVNWSTYKFVLLPIHFDEHYSFIVIETPLQIAGTICYHVHSFPSLHGPAHIFVSHTFAYAITPLQSNKLDCDVYMLHYMGRIAWYIENKNPDSFEDKMDSLTSGSQIDFSKGLKAGNRLKSSNEMIAERLRLRFEDGDVKHKLENAKKHTQKDADGAGLAKLR
ncbi:hypothetical protein GN958_ATG20705, partial [Phytophthora infestans]